MWISSESKAARGWHLRTGQTEGGRLAQVPKLGRLVQAAAGFHDILGGTLGHLVANIGATLRGDPEALHQMRRSFFGCEIEFGSNVDEVVFPKTVNLMPIVSADPYLNNLLIQYCEEAISYRVANCATLRSNVENAIAPLLPHGKARANEIARRLGMSHRTLARWLSSEGVTFSGILDELKADLAACYLKNGDLPISQIAWLLGYHDVSAFTHAFKRWTGSSPRQSRAREDSPSTRNRARRPGLGSQARSRK